MTENRTSQAVMHILADLGDDGKWLFNAHPMDYCSKYPAIIQKYRKMEEALRDCVRTIQYHGIPEPDPVLAAIRLAVGALAFDPLSDQ